jgi:hypothetical protein
MIQAERDKTVTKVVYPYRWKGIDNVEALLNTCKQRNKGECWEGSPALWSVNAPGGVTLADPQDRISCGRK